MQSEQDKVRTRKTNDLSLQHISIMDIKCNVQSIKASNAVRRKQLQQFFLARSQVQPTTSTTDTFPLPPKTRKPQNPQSLPPRPHPKSLNRRLKTQQVSYTSQKADKTQMLYFNPNNSRFLEQQSQTHPHDNPQRSDSIQEISKLFKGNRRQLYKSRHSSLYDQHVSAFQTMYENLNNVMVSLRKKQRILQEHIKEYLEGFMGMAFIDEFILQCEPKYQRVLRTSRLMELMGVLYVAVELCKGTLHEQYNNLGNFVGYSAASLVLIAKLYILSEKSTELSQSRFEEAIAVFEKTAYYSMLHDPYDIVLRIQHNNETVMKVQTTLARNNVKLQARLRQFAKQYHQQNYPSSLAFVFLFQYLSYYLHANNLSGIAPFLDIAPCPYLPIPATTSSPKPLIIIQPYNVLIWSQLDKFYVRPYTGQFLDFLCQHAQVVFWTHLMPNEIQGLLDRVDQAHKIQSRLFKYHSIRSPTTGIYMKDVSRLGRDINEVFVVDCDRKVFGEYTQNGVEMYWAGARKDRRLLGLCDLFAEMFAKKWNAAEFTENMQDRLNELRTVKMKPRRTTPVKRKNLEYRLMNF